jgi:hypothetical protein
MQNYLAATLFLLVILGLTTAYAWQAPQDNTPRVAVLLHAKPSAEAAVQPAAEPQAEASPERIEISLSPAGAVVSTEEAPSSASGAAPEVLPGEYDRLEPTAELNRGTTITDILFSTDISDDYRAISPLNQFVKGFFTLYATFDYEGFEDGLVWSWVWRRNGQVMDGGNQVWDYGAEGPGYVYLQPEEGFSVGSYSLEVWVNDRLFKQAAFAIIDGVSANN